ncbi:hypothetical protein VP464E531_P0073 [Vibrio phage 464E53-1]|nr:hypothetical protein VP464E531_P0073 [Vibrio phage 464E53-1]
MLNKGLVKTVASVLERGMMATFVSSNQVQVFGESFQFVVTFDNGLYTIEGVSFLTGMDIEVEPCNKESLAYVITLLLWGISNG